MALVLVASSYWPHYQRLSSLLYGYVFASPFLTESLTPLFGLQVNTAARMETTSEPGRVQLSEAAAGALKRLGCSDFGIVSRGKRMIKGKVGDAGRLLLF